MHDDALHRPPAVSSARTDHPQGLGSSPLHRCGVGFRPRVDDRDDDLVDDESLLVADSFLSLKNPNTGREQTGTLSTTGATRTPDE